MGQWRLIAGGNQALRFLRSSFAGQTRGRWLGPGEIVQQQIDRGLIQPWLCMRCRITGQRLKGQWLRG